MSHNLNDRELERTRTVSRDSLQKGGWIVTKNREKTGNETSDMVLFQERERPIIDDLPLGERRPTSAADEADDEDEDMEAFEDFIVSRGPGVQLFAMCLYEYSASSNSGKAPSKTHVRLEKNRRGKSRLRELGDSFSRGGRSRVAGCCRSRAAARSRAAKLLSLNSVGFGECVVDERRGVRTIDRVLARLLRHVLECVGTYRSVQIG